MNYGSGDIGDFGTSGFGAFDHGREHLGGDDAEFGMGAAKCDEFALDDRNDFGAGFDSHVATSNHDAVGGFYDIFEILLRFDGFLGFDFRNNLGGGTERKQHLFEFNDVAGGLDEGEGNVVVVTTGAVFDVGEIFLGQNVAAEIGVGEVEAFFGHNKAVVFDFDFDGGIGDDFSNSGFDFTIKHRKRFAGFDFAGEVILNRYSHAAIVFEVIIGFEN